MSESNKLQVPPTFLLVFSNFLMIALTKFDVMKRNGTLHLQQIIELMRPLEPEGILSFEFKCSEIIDKGNATILTWDFQGRDKDDKETFFLQTKFYELKDSTVQSKKSNQQTTKEKSVQLTNNEPGHIFEFKTNSFNPTEFFNPTENDLKESLFSPNHWRQYCDIAEEFSTEPNCHGRYYLGVVMNDMINHFANGDTTLFKRVQTRFMNPVIPNDTLITKSWKKSDGRVHFETVVMETGKSVVQGILDLNN